MIFFGDDSSKADFSQVLQNLANLMPETQFYSKLKFSVEIL